MEILNQWTVTKLPNLTHSEPVSMGGMGLRSAETNCSVAYVTSQILTEHMVAGLLGLDEVELETEEAMVHLDYLLGEERPQLLSEESLGGETQCTLSHKMDEFIQSQPFWKCDRAERESPCTLCPAPPLRGLTEPGTLSLPQDSPQAWGVQGVLPVSTLQSPLQSSWPLPSLRSWQWRSRQPRHPLCLLKWKNCPSQRLQGLRLLPGQVRKELRDLIPSRGDKPADMHAGMVKTDPSLGPSLWLCIECSYTSKNIAMFMNTLRPAMLALLATFAASVIRPAPLEMPSEYITYVTILMNTGGYTCFICQNIALPLQVWETIMIGITKVPSYPSNCNEVFCIWF